MFDRQLMQGRIHPYVPGVFRGHYNLDIPIRLARTQGAMGARPTYPHLKMLIEIIYITQFI